MQLMNNLKDNGFLILVHLSNIELYYSSDENSDKIIEVTNPISLNKINGIIFYTYYSFDKENIGMDHQFIFKLSITLPESNLTT